MAFEREDTDLISLALATVLFHDEEERKRLYYKYKRYFQED